MRSPRTSPTANDDRHTVHFVSSAEQWVRKPDARQGSGPLAGGFIGRHYGMRAVFFATSALMLLGDAGNWIISKAHPGISTGQAAENISSNAGARGAITPIQSVNTQPA